MPFQVTTLHQTIFNAYDKLCARAVANKGEGEPAALALCARAGCGKTSTLIELMRRTPTTLSIGYTSFARKNITDIEPKLADLRREMPARGVGLVANTMHSFGGQAIRRRFRSKLVKEKAATLWREMVADKVMTKDEDDIFYRPCMDLADKGRQVGEIDEMLLERFPDMTPPDGDSSLWPRALELARKLVAMSLEDLSAHDFGDMLYAPVKLGLAMEQFDVMMVDEAQDLSSVQREMVRMMLKPGGVLVMVGDDRQAIYAFRGADSNSWDLGVDMFKATVLPLNVSYRCPKAVASVAKQYVPDFTVTDANPEGVVRDAPMADATIEEMKVTDYVLCRANAPLVALAFRMIRMRKPCKVLGRDIEAGLLALIKKLNPRTIGQLSEKLERWVIKESSKISDKDRNKETKLEAIRDKADVLRVFAENVDSVAGLQKAIKDLFNQYNGGVTLATVHKVKGAEADRVYILKPEMLPASWAKTAEQAKQEQNLAYVAVTRAKHELVFLRDG